MPARDYDALKHTHEDVAKPKEPTKSEQFAQVAYARDHLNPACHGEEKDFDQARSLLSDLKSRAEAIGEKPHEANKTVDDISRALTDKEAARRYSREDERLTRLEKQREQPAPEPQKSRRELSFPEDKERSGEKTQHRNYEALKAEHADGDRKAAGKSPEADLGKSKGERTLAFYEDRNPGTDRSR